MSDFEQYRIIDCRRLDPFQSSIEHALTEIGKRSGGYYPSNVVFFHLRKRVIEFPQYSAVLIIVDELELAEGKPESECVAAVVTVDIMYDEIGMPLAAITRAWCKPGLMKAIWPQVRAWVSRWGEVRNCIGLVMQSERDTAWCHALKADGFEIKETILRAPLYVPGR